MIDIHSHILPNIDDGARSLADSIEIIKELSSEGVTDIIATPHYVDETNYVSPRSNNLLLLDVLKQALAVEGISTKVYLGNETYVSEKIIDLIKDGKVSTLADSEYMLVELPINGEYSGYEDVLLELMQAGYKVVLAHPERYEIVQKDYDVIRELYDMGVLLQCNLGSVVGKYGKGAQKTIKKLAKDRMIFALGSDVHRSGRGKQMGLARKKLVKYYNDDELEKIFVKNPGQILGR